MKTHTKGVVVTTDYSKNYVGGEDQINWKN